MLLVFARYVRIPSTSTSVLVGVAPSSAGSLPLSVGIEDGEGVGLRPNGTPVAEVGVVRSGSVFMVQRLLLPLAHSCSQHIK